MKILERHKIVILGLACFLLGALVAVVAAKNYFVKNPKQETLQVGEALAQVTPCGVKECLFRKDSTKLLGITTLRAYYTKHQKENISGQIDQCDGLIVVEGSKSFVDNINQYLKEGRDGYGEMYDDDQIMINFPLHFYSNEIQQKIKSSSASKPLDIKLLLPELRPVMLPSCNSLNEYKVLSIETPERNWLY